MNSTVNTSYDEVLYRSWPFAQSHPDRLATVASMMGMDPAPEVSPSFRMLELGSACGDNLIPLAIQHPQAEFVGVDASPRQVEAAREAARQVGVENIEFQQLDIMDFPLAGEPFEFIVAHGVYSWVPPAVRDRLLEICGRRLTPQGVAYVSYNVLPGCKMKQVVREVLQHHIRHLSDPREQIAEAMGFLRFMAEQVPHENPAYASLWSGVLKSLGEDEATATRLFHDLLETYNDPVYFHEFVSHAARFGLKFVGEADITEMHGMQFPQQVASVLAGLGDEILQREQYMDFFKHRPFRQTLLCREGATVRPKLQPERLQRLLIGGDLECEGSAGNQINKEPLRFRAPSRGVEATVDQPLVKAALLHMQQAWPRVLPFEDVAREARAAVFPAGPLLKPLREIEQEQDELLADLAQLYAAGLIEAHAHHPHFVTTPGERPLACPWARRQARCGVKVTNRWHQGVKLGDLNHRLLLLLDGTRDHAELTAALGRQMRNDGLAVVRHGTQVVGEQAALAAVAEIVEEAVQTAARLALLVG